MSVFSPLFPAFVWQLFDLTLKILASGTSIETPSVSKIRMAFLSQFGSIESVALKKKKRGKENARFLCSPLYM